MSPCIRKSVGHRSARNAPLCGDDVVNNVRTRNRRSALLPRPLRERVGVRGERAAATFAASGPAMIGAFVGVVLLTADAEDVLGDLPVDVHILSLVDRT